MKRASWSTDWRSGPSAAASACPLPTWRPWSSSRRGRSLRPVERRRAPGLRAGRRGHVYVDLAPFEARGRRRRRGGRVLKTAWPGPPMNPQGGGQRARGGRRTMIEAAPAPHRQLALPEPLLAGGSVGSPPTSERSAESRSRESEGTCSAMDSPATGDGHPAYGRGGGRLRPALRCSHAARNGKTTTVARIAALLYEQPRLRGLANRSSHWRRGLARWPLAFRRPFQKRSLPPVWTIVLRSSSAEGRVTGPHRSATAPAVDGGRGPL